MGQTISIMESETEEVQALEVFNLILTYAGLAQQSNKEENNHQTDESQAATNGGNKETDENDHVFLIQVNWQVTQKLTQSWERIHEKEGYG